MARLVSSLGQLLRVNVFCCMLLCYLLLVLLGGAVFTAVERPVEEELRVEVEDLRRSFLRENPCVEESRLRELLGKALSAHRRDVAVLKVDASDRRYDFTSSLFFVIVTLTTMGKNQWGVTLFPSPPTKYQNIPGHPCCTRTLSTPAVFPVQPQRSDAAVLIGELNQ